MTINFIFFVSKWNFKILQIFLDITSDDKDLSKFVTIKWIEIYDQSEENYNINKEVRIKASI